MGLIERFFSHKPEPVSLNEAAALGRQRRYYARRVHRAVVVMYMNHEEDVVQLNAPLESADLVRQAEIMFDYAEIDYQKEKEIMVDGLKGAAEIRENQLAASVVPIIARRRLIRINQEIERITGPQDSPDDAA